MFKKSVLFIFIVYSFISKTIVAQNIGGIINIYTSVTSIVGTTISVSSSAGFITGNKVLIIQMKGAGIDQANTPAYGDVLAYNNAGNYEYATITGVSGNNITIQSPLCKQYSIPDLVQLITVPEYITPTITSTLMAQDWNGVTGGVLVFEASDTVIMNADINVSGNGFRGGITYSGSFGCSNPNYYLSTGVGGEKGESISKYINMQECGRGKLANGGGGGNPGNSGGGGGGNSGAGGIGGNEYSGCGATGVQGIGGSSVSYSGGKIFLGGGGGGGFGDNAQSITPGTDGGGIVIITANTIIGNNFFIRSNGLHQTLVANDESAGGGGSGGSVFLSTANFPTTLNITTNGGDGGNTYNNIFTGQCHGTGGGGGGGILWINGATLPATINFTTNGGQPGIVQNPASQCYNTSFGALAGQNGNALFNLPSIQPLVPVDLGNDTSVCPAQTLVFDAGANYTTYLWNDASTNQTLAFLITGSYSVTVTNASGCSDIDTLTISLLPPIVFSIGNDTAVCPQQPIFLDAGAGFTNYLWNNGSTSQTISTVDSGDCVLTVTNNLGCIGIDTVEVNWFTPQIPILGNDTSICLNGQFIFDPGVGFNNYLWADGSTTQSYIAINPGLYTVSVTDANGCTSIGSASVLSFVSPPSIEINDTFLCHGTPVFIQSPNTILNHIWSDSTTNSFMQVNSPGIYSITIITIEGCTKTDSFEVKESCPVLLYFPNAFSPNGDGVNDEFFPIDFNVSEFHMHIYNRWGQLIFESNNLSERWNGTFKEQLCAIGVYVYSATYSGESDGIISSGNLKGSVTLIK